MKVVILAVLCVVTVVTSCPIIVNIASPDASDHTHIRDERTNTTDGHTHAIGDHTHSIGNHTHPTHTPQHHTHSDPDFIAFSVGTRKGFSTTTTARIPMEVILYDPGGHFHSDNAFYAPIKGVYSFTFSGSSAYNNNIWLELCTQKRGESKVSVAIAFDDSASGEYAGSSGSVIITMEVNESASVWLGGPGSSFQLYPMPDSNGPSTLFSGKLEKKLN